MSKDYVYDKAPLVEVIAEIHWALKEIGVVPNVKIDPYYDLFKEEFLELANDIGLDDTQELIPDTFPFELTPNQPRLRLQSRPERWPLAQIGPGIVTANIVPPYDGWAIFESFLHKLVDGLFANYPIVEKTLCIEKLHLRYIDGFDESFGLINHSDFVSKMLGVNVSLSDTFINSCVKDETEVTYLLETHFFNSVPDGSFGRLRLVPGQLNNRKALIMELHCESVFSDRSATESGAVKDWFLAAHQCLRTQFEKLTTPSLKSVMGDKKEIG